MNALWYKEWREFAPSWLTLLVRLVGPLLLLGPLMLHPTLSRPALVLALGLLGTTATAAQVARERIAGVLGRLGLSPHPSAALVLQRVLGRAVLVLVQVGPLLALAPGLIATAVPLALTAVAAGAWLGLRAPTRRAAWLGGVATAALAGLGAAQLAPAALIAPPLWLAAGALTAAAAHAAPAIFQVHAD